MARLSWRVPVIISVSCLYVAVARAQNPVQWSGSVEQSVARANEQLLPLLFWISGDDDMDDDDDLDDAQEACFRDPTVVNLVHAHFVPVHVSRNSRVLEAAQELGLPTAYGRYCAVLTADGRLLDQMGPTEIADPGAFAAHLVKAYSAYCDDLYTTELLPIFQNPDAPKSKVRLAAQTVYRLDIRRADADVIRLLDRSDLTPSERSRLYSLLASLATQSCVDTLLDVADDKAAADALRRAEPDALEWLIPAMPGESAEVTERQLLAYRSAVSICRLGTPKPDTWWTKVEVGDRQREIDRVTAKAEAVLDYWKQSQGLGP